MVRSLALLLVLWATAVVALPVEQESRSVPKNSTNGQKINQFMLFGSLVQTFLGSLGSGGDAQPPIGADSTGRDVEGRDAGFQMSCGVCHFAVNLLISYVANGRSNEEIAQRAITICTTFRIESPMVCEGAVNSLVDDIVYIVKHSTLNEKDACAFVMGERCEEANFEEKFNWTVSLPDTEKPPVKPIQLPKDNQHIKRVLHLSDTHFDQFYQEGSNAVCGAPLCCRASLGMPEDETKRAGKWGDYRDCDSPRILIENMLKFISDNHKLDYIIWTGDLPPHDVYNQTKSGNIFIIKEVTEMLKKYFPNIPIFPALGNHESEPVNCFPQPEVEKKYSISWLYDELSKSWSQLVNHNVSSTVARGGFYSVLAEPGFRIISLNMNYCNTKNWWLLINNTDPASELKWLVNELDAAEQNNEKVHILGHIPPGHEDCARVWSRNFHKIVSRYENIITAQFYGHTHYDELLLFYDEEEDPKRPINVAYIGSSTTPYSNMNPAYKIYIIDGNYNESSRMVLDEESYYMNLTEANTQGAPTWKKLYSAKENYNLSSLLPSDWDKFMRLLPKDDKLFQQFLRNMHRNSDVFPRCDAKCKQEMICRQVSAKTGEHSLCVDLGVAHSDGNWNRPGFITS